jgi:putative alpha-1,2-mannosidase
MEAVHASDTTDKYQSTWRHKNTYQAAGFSATHAPGPTASHPRSQHSSCYAITNDRYQMFLFTN